MSVVDTVVRLTRQVASRTAHAIVHPVETATAAVSSTKDPDPGDTERDPESATGTH